MLLICCYITKKKYEEKVKKYVKLYANDVSKKDINDDKKEIIRKTSSDDQTNRKSFKAHSINIDFNYNFYEDDDTSPVFESEEDKSCISSNSSLNEELDFGKFNY